MSFFKFLFPAFGRGLAFGGKKEKIRTRFAPSPTGQLHVGSVRTALFNFLFAKKFNGEFILRIEDTDWERSEPEYEKEIVEGLKWLNIHWNEGPYRQSERLDIYVKYLKELLDNGDAFYCFHSKEFLKKEIGLAHHCEFKKLPLGDLETRLKKESAIIRFKTPLDLEIAFIDLIRGEIRFNSDTLGGDFSLAKAESPDKFLPLYNFAVVIDDFEMCMIKKRVFIKKINYFFSFFTDIVGFLNKIIIPEYELFFETIYISYFFKKFISFSQCLFVKP